MPERRVEALMFTCEWGKKGRTRSNSVNGRWRGKKQEKWEWRRKKDGAAEREGNGRGHGKGKAKGKKKGREKGIGKGMGKLKKKERKRGEKRQMRRAALVFPGFFFIFEVHVIVSLTADT